ncbi:MAG: phasin family protein [Rhodocyclaceae bacterium]|nr:phasin family protein [Rhodocyclaceae bacterium]
MNVTPEKFAAANKASLDTAASVASLGLSTVERLMALNLNTVRAAIADAGSNAEALLAAKDPKAALSVLSGLAEPTLASVLGYYRSAYGIVVDSGEELGKIADGQIAELNKAVTIALDEMTKSAPAGSDVAVAAVKSAIAAANATYDSVTKATKKVVEIAEANVTSTTGAAVKAVGKAAKKAA